MCQQVWQQQIFKNLKSFICVRYPFCLSVFHTFNKIGFYVIFQGIKRNTNLDRTGTKPTGMPPEIRLQGDKGSLINTSREWLSNQL